MKPILCLSEASRARIGGWAENGYPQESCGLMLGARGPGGVRVEQVTEARNVNTERPHDRYEVAPEAFLAADELAEQLGLEVVGVWHTHPDQPAQPSETDRTGAWAGWSYLILSVVGGKVLDLRSWRFDAEHFFEETVRTWQP